MPRWSVWANWNVACKRLQFTESTPHQCLRTTTNQPAFSCCLSVSFLGFCSFSAPFKSFPSSCGWAPPNPFPSGAAWLELIFAQLNSFKKLFINFWAVLGLCCCVDFSLVAAHRLLVVVAFLVEHRPQDAQGFSGCSSWALEHRFSGFGSWAYLLLCMRNLPWSGIKPVSPALAGRFFTPDPPGKPSDKLLHILIYLSLSFYTQKLLIQKNVSGIQISPGALCFCWQPSSRYS